MDNLAADFEINPNNPLNAEYELGEGVGFDCSFELYASGTVWGSIAGDISNQTDLYTYLTDFDGRITINSNDILALGTSKQDVLTAGANIQITDNVISATDTTYTAGSGIDITNNVISCTVNSVQWGNITGDITEQTDLINLLNGKVDIADFDDLSQTVTNNYNKLSGDITDLAATVTDNYNTLSGQINDLSTTVDDNYTSLDNRLTTAEGSILDLTDTVTDNYTELNGKITDNTDDITTIQNIINSYGDIVTYDAANFATANQGALADTSLQPNDNITLLNNNAGYITSADIPTLADLTTTAQLEAINSGATSTKIEQIATNTQNIADEVTNRQNADNGLQSQIDALVVASDVFDIVGTYAELQAYDISSVPVNDIIKVLVDSTHSNAATYYRCVETGSVKSWSYIGSEGAYYTKSEADGRFVAQTITVNGKPLSSNVTLTASDVGALPDSVSIPTATSDLTNDSGFITSSALSPYALISSLSTVATSGSYNDLLDKPYIPSGVIVDQIYDSSSTNAQSGVAIAGAGFLTSITSSDVTTALGYTPYNSTNPSGYITSSALTNYVTTNTAQNISGRKTFLGEKAIYFKQTATTDKLGFTLYNPSNTELGALEYRPNTINGNALLALNCPQATGGYVGFRYWGSPAVNIVAPKVATAGNYYISTHITDGTNTVTADSTGKVNISTLLPDVSNFVTNSSLATTLADYVTNANLTTILSDYALTSSLSTVATSGSYNDLTNKPTIPDISNLANKDLSNLSSTGESKFQAPLVSGTNIKTINNTSLLGSGNISLAGDDTTINKNLDDELQTIGVIDDNVQNAYNFTVVGSPTITADGVVSGFSSSNYLVYSTFDTSKPWGIRFKFNCNKYDTIQGLIRLNAVANACVMVRPNGAIFFRNRLVSSVADLSSDTNFIQLNTDYICDIGWTGTIYYLKINNNLISSINSTEVTQLDETYLGIGQAGYYSTTSNIDLKQFSITVDGVEVYRAWQPPALRYWTGTKAQYDALTFDNFAVVGSPTITDDGVVSGFSASNYITIANPLIGATKYSIKAKFTLPSTISGYGYVFADASGTTGLSIYYDSNNVMVRCASQTTANSIGSPTANSVWEVEVIYDNGTAIVNYTKNGVSGTKTLNMTGYTDFQATNLFIGQRTSGMDTAYFKGSIDLKQFKITVGGTEVYRAFGRPDANTLYNVEGVGLYKGTTLISNDGVSKSGDTMTGDLSFYRSEISTISPREGIAKYIQIYDINDELAGELTAFSHSDGSYGNRIAAINQEHSTWATIEVGIDSNGNNYCTFPNTTCVDGQYTETNETIVSSLNLNNSNSSDTGWYTLSSLPDNGEYLCWIIGRGTTGSTSGNYIYCRVVSDIVTDYMTCCATRTRTASTVSAEGVICIPVKNKRVKIKRDANWDGTGVFILRGYRRIGTNA